MAGCGLQHDGLVEWDVRVGTSERRGSDSG
jgi:hypothetical protein